MIGRFAAFCLVVLFVGGPVAAQDRPLVSNVFFQSDLRQALEDVAAQAGVNIIADPTVEGIVSVTLDNVTVDQALDLLLAGTGYLVDENPDYFLVYTPDVASDVFTDVARTEVFQLNYISPEAARDLLPESLRGYVRFEPGSTRLTVTAPEEITERIEADLDIIDQPTDQTSFYALAHIRADAARVLLPENLQRFVRVDPARNTLAITAPAGARADIIAQLQRLDVPLPAISVEAQTPFPTQIVKLDHATALSVANLLPATVTQYVRVDEVSNSLAISAPSHIAQSILHDISAIDIPRQHIMLDARIVVLEQSDFLDFGNAFRWPQISAGGLTGDLGDLWEVRVGYTPGREFTNALSLTLNLLTQNEQATIVASPQVLAQDGIPSEIRVTTEEYFQITAEEGTIVQGALEQIETGTILSITPQVGGNGMLTLDMTLEVSDVVARGQDDLPVVSRRTAISRVQIENGGTAAVAGLVDTRSQISRSGVPMLGAIPFLGRAFRTDRLDHDVNQVAIFITATLVDGSGQEFQTGRSSPPRGSVVDEDVYRGELAAALAAMGVAVQ